MKTSKYIIVILLSVIFISGCNSVKKTILGSKENSADEFLVKKKNPLVLPPNYSDLPKPIQQNEEVSPQNEDIDFSGVLSKSKNKKNKAQTQNNSLEESISSILKSN